MKKYYPGGLAKNIKEMEKLELEDTQLQLSRDGGNTLRRYVDDKLRSDLGLPPRKQAPSRAARRAQIRGLSEWDDSLKRFRVYSCNRHNFCPPPITVEDKCKPRECIHLKQVYKKEIVVKRLTEALRLKSRSDRIMIEDVGTGFRVFQR